MPDMTHNQRYEVLNPQWEQAGKVHDWRNHVPEFVQEMWETFPDEIKFLLYRWADDLAGREHWD